MTVRLLRWLSGYGGDTLLRMILLSTPQLKTNVVFESKIEIADNGSTRTQAIQLYDNHLTEIYKIASELKITESVNKDKLNEEIQNLISSSAEYFLKSHYYASDILDELTIDIVADDDTLPFVIEAAINKTKVLSWDYEDKLKLIKDPEIRKMYTFYVLAQMHSKKNCLNKNQVPITTILSNWDTLCAALHKFNIHLSENVKSIYDDWILKNSGILPSGQYKNYILTKNYHFNDKSLTMAERYSLLVLAQEKFKVLN